MAPCQSRNCVLRTTILAVLFREVSFKAQWRRRRLNYKNTSFNKYNCFQLKADPWAKLKQPEGWITERFTKFIRLTIHTHADRGVSLQRLRTSSKPCTIRARMMQQLLAFSLILSVCLSARILQSEQHNTFCRNYPTTLSSAFVEVKAEIRPVRAEILSIHFPSLEVHQTGTYNDLTRDAETTCYRRVVDYHGLKNSCTLSVHACITHTKKKLFTAIGPRGRCQGPTRVLQTSSPDTSRS